MHSGFNGKYVVDKGQPLANGRSHYSTKGGGHHLFYTIFGQWVIADKCSPDAEVGESGVADWAVAAVAAAGAVPLGAQTWECNGGTIELTVGEV